MTEAKEQILEDAIKTAIEAERENVLLEKSVVALALTCVILAGIIMGLLLR